MLSQPRVSTYIKWVFPVNYKCESPGESEQCLSKLRDFVGLNDPVEYEYEYEEDGMGAKYLPATTSQPTPEEVLYASADRCAKGPLE